MEAEVWRPIDGFSDYCISDAGRVRNKFGQVLSSTPDKHTGYVKYSLRRNGDGNSRLGHRLVATAFLPNPDGKPQVNHINGIRSDNRAVNLEWALEVENSNRKVFPQSTHWTKKVAQVDPGSGEVIRVWDSLKAAAAGTNTCKTSISSCCAGRGRTAGGFCWVRWDDSASNPAEEWRQVTYDGHPYTVSSLGRVRYGTTGTVSTGSPLNGYRIFHNRANSVLVHRLVALAFVPNPDPANKPCVNHRDGRRDNNIATNLEWANRTENTTMLFGSSA